MTHHDIGTISHGTLLAEHLIPAFIAELPANHPLRVEYAQRTGWIAMETADEFVAELIDALNDEAPEGTYFGAHPGDGSDFGFWPTELLD